MTIKKLLILGGTPEAVELAHLVGEYLGDRLQAILSFSGITGHQPDVTCDKRVGGFGGVAGLGAYLAEEQIDYIVDATHPFAEKISQHAYMAAHNQGLPIMVLKRPPWRPQSNDHWLEVDDIDQAVDMVANMKACTFLTIGIKELDRFDGLEDVPLVVRLINEPKEELPLSNYTCVLSNPPFSVEDEQKLIRDHKIKILVTKNSGGEQTKAKLEAARLENVSVILINRPPSEPLEETSSCQDVLKWLVAHGA
ncbi:MAG: cobalt-precorrin-6A reductase [Methylocystaceae bacterium]|nr:cobalt-precorrin-6A reductase [Methylocystaceae bacterium]